MWKCVGNANGGDAIGGNGGEVVEERRRSSANGGNATGGNGGEAINGILGVDTAPDVLMCLKSLVVYEPGGPIVIRHTSFRDYLVSCKGNPWYIDPEVQKVYIASRCLERMGDFLRYNICDIPSIYVLNSDVPDLENRVTQCIPPFLKYICCNWAQHLRDVPYSQDLCSQLRSFAHNQLLFWFEILSLTDTFNDYVGPALLLSIDWIGVSTFININVLWPSI